MLYSDYNYYTSNDNITYSIDMIRLKCELTFNKYDNFVTFVKTCYLDCIDKNYVSFGIGDFKYNYTIKTNEGNSFWFGFIANSELINNKKSLSNDKNKYNFTVEFNPNKVDINDKILSKLLKLSSNWTIKSVDIAIDLKINILDLCGFDKARKKDIRTFCGSEPDDKTVYMGRTDNRIKIYNKKRESKLDYDLTRIEISSKLDITFKELEYFQYDLKLPDLYLNNYMYSFSDYKDKTLLAQLYAIQAGYPLNYLNRSYKEKIKNLLEVNGCKVNISNKDIDYVLHKTINKILA